ncbi:MAG TPA: helix-turn-helix transcriptional regulator [Acidimicrobiales bacterium]|nr:helix-turn-helix transcriptional regulator [Acidimicrobiales bacterium]
MAILGLLEEQELHGYEVRRQLRDHLGLLANVSFGSLYPALSRLERAGAVEAVDAPAGAGPAPAPPPPTGSLSGEWAVLRARRHAGGRARKSRKVYRITPSGRQLFAELLAGGGGADDARSFGLRLAFARHLAPGARLALLERRRAQLVQRLAEVETTSGETQLDVYARSVVEHTAEGVARDIAWLDRLIEAERAASGPAQGAGPADPEGSSVAAVATSAAGGGAPSEQRPARRGRKEKVR